MRIGFIGAGKVGFSMGRYFMERDVHVSGYYSRNLNSSKEAAIFTKTRYYERLEDLVKESDTLFLTVPDGDIEKVYSKVSRLDIRGKCLVHCSGALSSDVFFDVSKKGARGCSIHPICAVSDKLTAYQNLSNTYFTIEGKDVEDMRELLRACGNPVEVICASQKAKYHAAAVFASNLVVGLYDIATGLLEECGLSSDFSKHALQSLFVGNAKSVAVKGAVGALTGPVEREDASTVKKHLGVLEEEKKEIYRLLSRQILRVAKEKNPNREYCSLDMMLERKGLEDEKHSNHIS